MQIILVHQRMAQARTFTLTPWHVLAAGLALLLLIGAGAVLVSALSLRNGGSLPLVGGLLQPASAGQGGPKDRYLRENLDAMAARLGDMQAQLVRLEALGERVAGLAGLKPQDFIQALPPPGRGGPAPTTEKALSMAEFQALLDNLGRQLEQRSDFLNVAETELMSNKLRDRMLPTVQPVNVAYNASGFGWRIDPITGRTAMHEGIDFIAPVGSAIVAAAGGVVVASEWHNDYGNMIEIDHGNDIVTRYAHASRVYVRLGDIVKRGDRIADVGTTGRSTGSHLHFEVRVKGVAQNPAKFLGSAGHKSAGL